jgi:hypothetical protein
VGVGREEAQDGGDEPGAVLDVVQPELILRRRRPPRASPRPRRGRLARSCASPSELDRVTGRAGASGRLRLPVARVPDIAALLAVSLPVAADPIEDDGIAEDVTHVRWVITERRGDNDSIQVAELALFSEGEQLPNRDDDGTIVVTNPGGLNPDSGEEEPEKVYDGDPETKWLDFDDSESTLVLEFPDPVTFDSYSWVTANDEEDRDPVSWKVEVSTDGIEWTTVHECSDVAVPTGRGETVGPFSLDGSCDHGTPTLPAALPPSLSCVPSPLVAGGRVTCTFEGGNAGIDILWRAAYNPGFASAGVTLDTSGMGEFSFVVPTAALGQELTVELVEWTAPVSLGVVGGPVPSSVPAGSGSVPLWPALLLALGAVLVLRRSAFGSIPN